MCGMTDYVAPPPPPLSPYAAPSAPKEMYASWGQRVGAYLLDMVLSLPGLVPMIAGFVIMATHQHTVYSGYSLDRYNYDTMTVTTEPTHGAAVAGLSLVGLGAVLMFAIWVWNRVLKQGRTGYSWGKGVVGIKLIKEETAQPTGGWWSVLREVLHTVNSALCYIGWLWPLWDRKRQTFSDMISRTVVIRQPKA
jgi:uncharacterized RDD family membrane protein YckC